jgi:hypothetical protein
VRLLDTKAILRSTLIQHQRLDAGGCRCGWKKLGASFADHQIEMYEARIVQLMAAAAGRN